MDARGAEDRSGGRGAIQENDPMEPGCMARPSPQAAPLHRSRWWVQLVWPQPGRKIVCGRNDCQSQRALSVPIGLWDTVSGRKLATLSGAFAPFAFRPDGKVLIAYADPVASGGHRAGHRTGALDDPVLTRTACKRESTSAPTVPRFLAPLRRCGKPHGCCDGTSSREKNTESPCAARGTLRLLQAANGPLLAEPKVARRPSIWSTCPGRRTASWPTWRSSAPLPR